MTHSPLCTRLNLWKATRHESPTALKSRIREDCLRSLKENRKSVFDNRRKLLGLTFDAERRQLQHALSQESEPMRFDDLLKLYDEVTAELAAASNEDLDHYLDELEAIASLEDQVVCPFCVRGEIKVADDAFCCSSCPVRFPLKKCLQSLSDFSFAFAKAVEHHSNHQNCHGPVTFTFDDDEYHPAALLCCSECEMVLPVF